MDNPIAGTQIAPLIQAAAALLWVVYGLAHNALSRRGQVRRVSISFGAARAACALKADG